MYFVLALVKAFTDVDLNGQDFSASSILILRLRVRKVTARTSTRSYRIFRR